MAFRPRRVLFIVPTLSGGGAERVIVTLLRHLDRTRFAPLLVVVDTRNAAFIDEVPEDVPLIDLRCTRVRYAIPKIAWLVWRERPDVVFSTLGYFNLTLALLRPVMPNGVRYVARESIEVSSHIQLKPFHSLWRLAYRCLYRWLDVVICQSVGMQQDLVRNFSVPLSKTIVIHNPVDVERIRQLASVPLPDDGKPRGRVDRGEFVHLVAAGRLDYQKGFDILIDALALCATPTLQLTILGDGPLREQLQQHAIERGVAHQVNIVGFQNNPYPFFARADAFVLSSRYEGLPNVVLEALACGTPVISLPAAGGGVQEILDGVAGCVITNEATAESLAEAIQRVSFDVAIDARVIERYAANTITRRYEQQLAVVAAV